MSQFKIINAFDKIFVSACVFLIIYAWLNFFTRNLWFSFVVSLILSSSVLFILFYILDKKKAKKTNQKHRLDQIEKTFLLFRTMCIDEKLELLSKMYSTTNNITLLRDSILYNDRQEVLQIFVATDERILSEQTFFRILEHRNKSAQKILIICENYNHNFDINLLKNLTVKVIDKTKFYDKYISSSNSDLDPANINTKKKRTMKQIASNLFIPEKAKQYFFCGLILIFSSVILPYQTYYLIFGSVLLLFSILCKLNPIINNRVKSKN